MFRESGSSGRILALGGSARAYCLGTMWETSWKDFRADLGALAGGECDVHIGCVSGAQVTDFIRHAKDSAAYGLDFYDWVSVAGGWHSSDLLVFWMSSMWKGLFYPNFAPWYIQNTSQPDAD